jgi:superfamily I DNA/RNA helicase
MDRIWSQYQLDVFNFVENQSGSAVILAVAGGSKTTVIVEAARRVPTDKRVAFVAFNRNIAQELQARVPPHVAAMTLNGMGYRAYLNSCIGKKKPKLESKKTRWIIDDNLNPKDSKDYGQGVAKLVGLAKAHGLVPSGSEGVGCALMQDTEQNWADLIEKFGVDFDGKDADPARGMELARLVLAEGIKLGKQVIDFDDQLYLPVIWQAKFNQYDVIFADECQDISAIQRAMLKISLVPGGRLIAVGDKAQSIYSFRGADTESINRITEEFNAAQLPLSVSYRCSRAVVAEAKKLVPIIEHCDTAPDGKVEMLATVKAETFLSTDAILCRLNAPLIELAYKLIRNGKACKVLGREIGQGLITVIKKMNAGSIAELGDRLDAYQSREVSKLLAKGREQSAAAVEDRVITIKIFIGQLKEDNRTVTALVDSINALFSDDPTGRLTLCSVHKSKGLEWERVFILDPQLMPCKWARQGWQQEQEKNIQYVAITRAKSELYYFKSEGWKDNNELEKPADMEAA